MLKYGIRNNGWRSRSTLRTSAYDLTSAENRVYGAESPHIVKWFAYDFMGGRFEGRQVIEENQGYFDTFFRNVAVHLYESKHTNNETPVDWDNMKMFQNLDNKGSCLKRNGEPRDGWKHADINSDMLSVLASDIQQNGRPLVRPEYRVELRVLVSKIEEVLEELDRA